MREKLIVHSRCGVLSQLQRAETFSFNTRPIRTCMHTHTHTHTVILLALEGGGNVTSLGRFAKYLRSILLHTDGALTEMTARAVGQLALAEGTYTAEYVVKRALEWISGNDRKKLAAVSHGFLIVLFAGALVITG